MVRISVLGPLLVEVDGQSVALPRGRQRLVLAALALAGGDVVSTDKLVDAVWDGSAPENAVATLQVHISHLRGALRAAGTGDVIATRSPGYVLTGAAEVDAVLFEQEVAEGRNARRAGRTADAAALLARALARWRGEVLTDVDADFVRPQRARLDELRRVALEERIEADLELGRHVEVASWLPAVARELRHQERLHGLLALAQYRSGRQADALTTVRDLGRTLEDDLGLDLSPDLRRLEHAVLEQSATLDWIPQPELPGSTLIGREAAMQTLMAMLTRPGIVTIVGPGGMGKTRLAAEVAHGAPMVELGSVGSRVLEAIAIALDVGDHPARPITEAVAAALPPLVVIDNCEHVLLESREVLAALAAQAPATTFLVTSREPLNIEGEQVHELAALNASDSVDLFLDRARPLRPSVTPSPAVSTICEALEGLPLAIELAAARMDILEPEQVAARLGDSLSLLTGGSAPAPSRHRTLRATFAWSHALLSSAEQDLFRRLAVLPGAWSLEDAEDVVGAPVVDVLAGLVRSSLVGVDRTGTTTRFRLAMPVRQFASELLEAAGEATQTNARLLAAMLRASPDRSYEAMRAALAWSVGPGGDPAGGLALCQRLVDHWFVRGALAEGRAWCAAALTAGETAALDVATLHLGAGNLAQAAGDFAGAGKHFEAAAMSSDNPTRVRGRFGLANLALLTGQPDALEQLEVSAALAREIGDDDLLMRCLNGLGVAARRAGDVERARTAGEDALRAARRLGDRTATATGLINLANLLQAIGRVDDARDRLEEALRVAREDDFARGVAGALGSLAASATDPAAARGYFEESLRVASAAGDRPVMAVTMANLGVLQAREGDASTARQTFEQYRALSEQMGDPRGVAFAAQSLAELACRADDAGAAIRFLRESLALRVEVGDEDRIAECLELAGLVLPGADAVRALASADTSRARTGLVRDEDAARTWDDAIAATRAHLSTQQFEDAWASGSLLPPAEVAQSLLATTALHPALR